MDPVNSGTDSLLSLLNMVAHRASAEIAVVGSEGLVGIALFLGGGAMPNRAVGRSAGHAYRLSGRLFKPQFQRSGVLQRRLHCTAALLTQMAQAGVCNRHH